MLTLANKNSIEATNEEEHYLGKQEEKIEAHPNPPNETRWPPMAMAGRRQASSGGQWRAAFNDQSTCMGTTWGGRCNTSGVTSSLSTKIMA